MTSVRLLWSLVAAIALLAPRPLNQQRESTPLDRLQAKIDVISVPNLSALELAGQFTNPSKELRNRVPPMGEDDLFLFPDKTYIYVFFRDIPPPTICDKGTWNLDAEILQLKSDKDITWKDQDKVAERRYILVRRRNHENELFLVGIERNPPYFERNAKDDPEFMFLLNSLKREKNITEEQAAPLRKKLMTENWKPDFYR